MWELERLAFRESLMTTGTIVRGTTTAPGRRGRAYKTIAALKGKGGHFTLQVFLFALGTTNRFRRPDDQGFKIMVAVLTPIFVNGHKENLLSIR
jgi:hypothetical protein